MRLLSKKEIKTYTAEKEIEKQKVINEHAKNIRAFHSLKADVDAKTLKIKEDFAKFSEELLEKRNAMLDEVKELEQRKVEALKPITDEIAKLETEKSLYKIMKDGLEQDLKEKEEKIKINTDIKAEVERRIEVFKEKEMQNEAFNRLLREKSSQLDEREQYLQGLSSALERDKWKKEQMLREKENELKIRENALETLISENNIERERIKEEQKHLYSQQQSLKSALAELKKYGSN
jgi:hypothetical protein